MSAAPSMINVSGMPDNHPHVAVVHDDEQEDDDMPPPPPPKDGEHRTLLVHHGLIVKQRSRRPEAALRRMGPYIIQSRPTRRQSTPLHRR